MDEMNIINYKSIDKTNDKIIWMINGSDLSQYVMIANWLGRYFFIGNKNLWCYAAVGGEGSYQW